MSGQETIGRDNRADWIIMRAVHDAFRRDLDAMIEAANRGRVLRLLLPLARLLYALGWLPRYTRRTAAFDPA